MMLLSFTENAFKYGSTENQEEPGIRIKFYIFDNPLRMAVVNLIKTTSSRHVKNRELILKY